MRPCETGSYSFSFGVTLLVFAFGLCPSESRTTLCVSRNVWVPLLGLVESLVADTPCDVVETVLGKSIGFLRQGGNKCTSLDSAVFFFLEGALADEGEECCGSRLALLSGASSLVSQMHDPPEQMVLWMLARPLHRVWAELSSPLGPPNIRTSSRRFFENSLVHSSMSASSALWFRDDLLGSLSSSFAGVCPRRRPGRTLIIVSVPMTTAPLSQRLALVPHARRNIPAGSRQLVVSFAVRQTKCRYYLLISFYGSQCDRATRTCPRVRSGDFAVDLPIS